MIQFWPSVGGQLRMVYGQGGVNLAPISLAVAPFDLTPSGPNNDYLYTGVGDVVPAESGILATFAALGALWAPYYDSSWSLRLLNVYSNDHGAAALLSVTPTAVPIVGTYAGAIDPMTTFKRTLSLWSRSGWNQRWRIYLRWLQGDRAGTSESVTTTAGGLDARDPAWYAYLSGSDTGVVGRDGTRYQGGGEVRQWFDTPL